jgi:hypothetical protein
VECQYLPRQPRTIRSRSADTVALKRAIFFLSGRAAGCTPGGARGVAASWLDVGRNSGPEKGDLLSVQPSSGLYTVRSAAVIGE